MSKHTHSRFQSFARRLSVAGWALAFALGVAGCAGHAAAPANVSPTPQPISDEVTRTIFARSLGVHLDQMLRHASGLYVQDVHVGTGAVALAGKSMVVRYVGYLSDGKKFDSGEITVTIGSSSTIQAWKEGLLGMRVGGQRRLVSPPNLAYGSRGAGSDIPPYAVLVFDIEMVAAI